MLICEHRLPVDDAVPTADQCQKCDWCPACELVRRFDGDVCSSCGYVWGEG